MKRGEARRERGEARRSLRIHLSKDGTCNYLCETLRFLRVPPRFKFSKISVGDKVYIGLRWVEDEYVLNVISQSIVQL